MGVYKRGNIYYARYWQDGRIHRKSLDTGDRRLAEDYFHVLYGEPAKRRRRHEAKQQKRRRAPSTVADALTAWLERVEVNHAGKPATIRSYRFQAGRWRRRWGSLQLAELDRGELESWRDARLARVAPRTVNTERAILLSFLNWCKRNELIEELPRIDPVRGVPRKRRRPPALEPEQVEALIRAAREHPKLQIRALEPAIWLGAYAGLRRAEICGLEWQDVDQEERILTVQPHGGFSPKSNESREVPLGPKLAGYLEALRQREPRARWVCLNADRGRWNLESLTFWACRLWKAAKIYEKGEPTLHALRHSYASWLVADGADVETVRMLLGHSSITTTELYFSTTLKRKRKAVESM